MAGAVSKAPSDSAQVDALAAPCLLTVLIPCLNEAETIAVCVRKARAFLAEAQVAGEVLVADNGSTDGSQALAISEGARLIEAKTRGYGAALAAGISAARGRYVIMADADDSYDLRHLESFLAELRKGADLVMGNRFVGGIDAGAMPALHRYLGNPVLTAIGRTLFKAPIRDFHCGLRGFNRAAIMELDLKTTGMEFASEMVVQASLAHLRIVEVATKLKKDGRTRKPHLRTWRDGWRHLRFLLLHSPRWTFGYPGLALILGGIATAAALSNGPVRLISGVSLDVHTFLIACTAVVVGVQSITFGLIARRFARRRGMLPPSRRYEWLVDRISLEAMLCTALCLMLVGLFGLCWSLNQWRELHFGAINGEHLLRLMIFSTSAIACAVQLGLSAFFLGVLDVSGGDVREQIRELHAAFTDAAR